MSTKYFVAKLTKEDIPGQSCCIEESNFATLFPTYLENYIVDQWENIEAILKKHCLKGNLDCVEGSMKVSTTRKTWDPYAIINGRDFIKLIARNIPVEQAEKIFEEGMYCDIIPIGIDTHNTRRFIKRRDRLIGNEGQTLKALEILTECYILVQGKTISVMGSVRGCQDVRKITEDCMKNIHPIYGLKRLLIRRELMKREDMKNEDWSRFLPVYKKSNVNKEKAKEFKKKRKQQAKKWVEKQKLDKSIFPPAPTKRKEDIAMETGKVLVDSFKTYRTKHKKNTDLEL